MASVDITKKPVAAAKDAVKAANLVVQGLEELYQLYNQYNNNIFDPNELNNAIASDMVGIEHIDSGIFINCLSSAASLFTGGDFLNITKISR